MQIRPICARMRDFLRRDTGSVSAEFVIWTPVFALVLSLVADTSLIFGSEAEVTRVVQDANRSLSLGRFMTVDAAKAYIVSEISHISPNAVIDMTVVNGIITTVVDMPTSDLTATGMFDAFATAHVYVRATQMSEA